MKTVRSSKATTILLTLTAILLTALEILDVTIVSVGIDAMRGSLGATINQISWTMTAYLIASAIMLPLTGYLSRRFGRKQLILMVIIGFCVSSMLCGLSQNLLQIVVLRFIQGAFGSLLAPLAQSVLAENFDRDQFGKAMSYFGIGLMVAPMMGPVLGGLITQNLNWRWDFYVNVPVCILAFFAVSILVKPSVPDKSIKTDWTGMFFLTLSIFSFEYLLNRGNELNWFDSNVLLACLLIAILSGGYFISRGWSLGAENIFNMNIFKDSNFGFSCLIMGCLAFVFAAINAWVPTVLQTIENYPVLDAGFAMLPRGLSSLCTFLVMPFLLKRVTPKVLLVLGLVFFSIGNWHLTQFTYEIDGNFFLFSNIVQGIGIGLFFPSLSVFAYSNIPMKNRDMAAGLFNFCKTIGNSLGVAIFSGLVIHEQQVNWHTLIRGFSVYNQNFRDWLNVQHLEFHSSTLPSVLAQKLMLQSSVLAYKDGFVMAMWICLSIIPICFLLKPKQS